jgi:hypothetical protein
MGIPLRITIRRNARGKSIKTVTEVSPGSPLFFNIPYERKLHHRVMLDSVRSLLRKPGRFSQRKARVALPWQEAILRNAPMLRGFFLDEPEFRDRLLRWCEKVLAKE